MFMQQMEVKSGEVVELKQFQDSEELNTSGVFRSQQLKRATDEPKADGPYNIPGCVQKDCAEKLKDVLTEVFNFSLSQGVEPMCFRAAMTTAV